jgi:hypothetical protein
MPEIVAVYVVFAASGELGVNVYVPDVAAVLVVPMTGEPPLGASVNVAEEASID